MKPPKQTLGIGAVESTTKVHAAGSPLTEDEQAWLEEMIAQGYSRDRALEAIEQERAEVAELEAEAPRCSLCSEPVYGYVKAEREGRQLQWGVCRRHLDFLRRRNPTMTVPRKTPYRRSRHSR